MIEMKNNYRKKHLFLYLYSNEKLFYYLEVENILKNEQSFIDIG
jgi:hypothetical protein